MLCSLYNQFISNIIIKIIKGIACDCFSSCQLEKPTYNVIWLDITKTNVLKSICALETTLNYTSLMLCNLLCLSWEWSVCYIHGFLLCLERSRHSFSLSKRSLFSLQNTTFNGYSCNVVAAVEDLFPHSAHLKVVNWFEKH